MFDLAYILTGVQSGTHQELFTTVCADCVFSSVVFDSRAVTPDALFVALPGEKTDGHRFLADVARAGGRGALVRSKELPVHRAMLEQFPRPWTIIDLATRNQDDPVSPHQQTIVESNEPDPAEKRFFFIAVDDPPCALWNLAQYHRSHFSLPIVGVTGSVGKTTTKEGIANVLSQSYRTLKSERSYNTGISIPTTVLQLTARHQAAVFELGMWARGEIQQLAHLIQPHIGVVTNIGLSHLERMGSIEAIADAKAELVESLPPDGVAILNADDEYVIAMAKRTTARVFRYGLYDQQADMRANALESYGIKGIGFSLHYQDQRAYVRSPMIGRHNVYTAMASASVGVMLGVPWESIIAGLRMDVPYGRLRLRQVGNDDQSYLIIDDTYNASPASMLAALNVLAECSGRRLAILGGMLELGAYTEEAHRVVGRHAAFVVQTLICVGPFAHLIAEEANNHTFATYIVETNEEAIALANRIIQPGDVVLVKGSRALEMETIVEGLVTLHHETHGTGVLSE